MVGGTGEVSAAIPSALFIPNIASIRGLDDPCCGVLSGTGRYTGLRQMKHQIDATLCRFYFCRVTLHVSGVKRPSSGVFKTSTAATGTCVIVAAKSSHLLIRALNVLSQMKHQLDATLCRFYFGGPNKEM